MAPFTMPSIPPSTLQHISESLPRLHIRSLMPSPSSTTASSPAPVLIARATSTTPIIPSNYEKPTMPPGQVAGIVIGSVVGAILLLWLVYSVVMMQQRGPTVDDVQVVTQHRGSHRSHRARSTRARSRSRSEAMTEVRSPPRRERRRERSSRRETVVIEESRPRAVSRPRSIIVDDMDLGDDVVEVIEEDSPPPQRRERRERRDRDSGMSGVRHVVPDDFGGGNGRRHRVR